MCLLRHVTVVALALFLFSPTAEAAGKGKKKSKSFKGKVTAVSKDSITVQVTKGKKKGTPTTTEHTFKIADSTTVAKITGKKGNKQSAPAAVSDVVKDQRVTIKATGDKAEAIAIVGKGKAKKAKT